MSDSTDSSINLQAGADADARATELFRAASPAFVYAKDDATTSGLTWGYRGGRWNSASISAGTQSIGASTTTYMVVNRSSGAVSFSTSTTNWNDDTTYARAYKIVSGSSSVTSWEDHRAGPLGTQGGSGGGGGGATRTPAVQSVTSSGTVTPTFDDDIVVITAQAAGLTLANPTGTAIPNLGMVIRIKDNGTARSISYGTQYRAVGVILPTTTVISKTLYLAMIYNSTDTKWDVLAVGQEA